MQSTGGNCIILCRKATKVSQEQIKEDVRKHQRRASSTALESFRGNNPERVTGKSLLCFPSVFRKTGFTTACMHSSAKERGTCPAAGRAGCEDMAAGTGGCRGAARTLIFSLIPCSPVAQSVCLSSNGHYSSLGLCRKEAFSGKEMWFNQLERK